MKAAPYRPLDLTHGRIDLTHGAGGRASAQLITGLFAAAFKNDYLDQGDDGAVLPAPAPGEALVFATDAHVVAPLFFPGGDIGSLAVHGTLNDLAMMGARPLYLSASFILEEGLALADLARIVASMATASRAAGVPIVTGDTKVVEQGKGDGLFISTAGLGARPVGRSPSGRGAQAGDAILVSGALGDHGLALLTARGELGLASTLTSDSVALHGLVEALFNAIPAAAVHVLRDPTRGGLATTLNEIAHQSGVGMQLIETAIPVNPQVAAACELLGLDPLYLANEGKLIAIVPAAQAAAALAALRAHPLGQRAAQIGAVTTDPRHFVQLRTPLGGQRLLDWLNGDPLPRIC
ncbi:hydrogenase expression/formation protein HypE [Betaproteobacteria bacterium]|nr:hydrogenase expression/formation protein HypE [Betaproteobacteria bacterium]GHU17003.1 hydrogenase expression/formation protein HypE [Betaproteobacteria bacterium]